MGKMARHSLRYRSIASVSLLCSKNIRVFLLASAGFD